MFKQPRVPEFRENEGVSKFLRALVLFLKDFCQDVWMACRLTDKGLDGIKYPVTSVNKKTGDVVLDAADVGALPDAGSALHQFKPTTSATADFWGLEQVITAKTEEYGSVGIRFWGHAAQRISRLPDGTYRGYKIYDTGNKPTASDVGALASNGTAVNANKLGGKTWADLKLDMFPPGAIYKNDTATSPAGWIGGVWERIDKSFPSSNSTAIFFRPASGVTVGTCYFSRSGHSISYRFTLSCASDLTDTAFTLGTIDFEMLGVTELNCDQYIIGNSDTAGGISLATIDRVTGEVIHRERVVNANGAMAANSDIVYKGVIESNQGRMIDSACNQFVYRRIS